MKIKINLKKVSIVLNVVLILFGLQTHAQKIKWSMAQTGSIIGFTSFAIDKSNAFYFTFPFKDSVDADFGTTSHIVKSVGKRDIVIAKYDSSRKFKAGYTIGGPENDDHIKVFIDDSNNLYLYGTFEDSLDIDLKIGKKYLKSISNRDAFIAKYDTSFNLIWHDHIKAAMNSSVGISSFVKKQNGEIVVGGGYKGFVDFDPGIGVKSSNTGVNNSGYILRLSSTGKYVNSKYFLSDAGSFNSIHQLAEIDSQQFLLLGYLSQNGIADVDPSNAVAKTSIRGNNGFYVLKLDSGLNYVKHKSLSSNKYSFIRKFEIKKSGSVVFCGDYTGTIDLNPNSGTNNFTSADPQKSSVFITEWDKNWNYTWAGSYGNSNNTSIYDCAITPTNEIKLTGQFKGQMDFNPSSGINFRTSNLNSRDGYVLTLRSNGNFKNVEIFGESRDDYMNFHFLTRNNELLLTGGFQDSITLGVTGTSTTYRAKQNEQGLFIIGLDDCPTAVTTLTDTTCNSKKSPSGLLTWTKSGVYKDSVLDVHGCDSLLTINLTVYKNTYDTIVTSNCDSLLSPSGTKTWKKTGVFQDILTNSSGCDSVIRVEYTNLSSSTITHDTACYEITSPSGKYKWIKSGSYKDTLINKNGCDSFITVHATINNSSIDSIRIRACSAIQSPSGRFFITQSGTYADTLINSNKCDSILYIFFTRDTSTYTKISTSTCNSLNSPSGKYLWTANGTYKDTLVNNLGCDSILTIQLTIIPTVYDTIRKTVCDTYLSPSGKYNWSVSGVYNDTLVSSNDCDSILTYLLTVNNSTIDSLNVFSCESFTSPSNKYTWTTSGLYQDTIANSKYCDSILFINVDILKNSYFNFQDTSCRSYTLISGKRVTETGVYIDTISNSLGCDSIVSQNILIYAFNKDVQRSGGFLNSKQLNVNYQWLECSNGFNLITSETNRFFKPTVSSNYAVELSNNRCRDTSNCITYNFLKVEDRSRQEPSIFPNPTTGQITIETSKFAPAKRVSIYNMQGQLVQDINQGNNHYKLTIESPGTYIVEVGFENGQFTRQLVTRY